MTSINRSFFYGICFASATWIVSLYLYTQLNQANDFSATQSLLQSELRTDESKGSLDYTNPNMNNYVNSNKLIRKLQPSVFKSKEGDEISDLGLVKTIEDQQIKDEGYKLYAYNILISNRLSYHRSLPDTRHELCRNLSYPEDLPIASIIICFYNEHFQTLLRTLHSIMDRTPVKFLKQIILIDDFSDIDNLYDNIDAYISQNFKKVKLFKTERREGLIRARIFGARKATGDVIIFLDSHVEVNVGWIEPLLYRIKQNKTNVVMPIIDVINPDTFIYTSSPLVRGGFNWGLHFKWDNLPKDDIQANSSQAEKNISNEAIQDCFAKWKHRWEKCVNTGGTLKNKTDFVKPIKSPTMAGGLFAMDRKYFTDLGEYDSGMNVWGGENLEISFRIWMCGGQLELIPCSRVGHIFRRRRPYGSTDGQDTMLYNSLRVANVWLDNYKEHFLNQQTNAKNMDYGDITSRLQLRKELKCKDFDWYLKHVYPELTLPTDDQQRLKQKWEALEKDKFQPWHSRKRNYTAQFQIRLSDSNLCLQSAKDYKTKGTPLTLKKCLRGKNQIWYETDRHELVLAQLLCLQAGKPSPYLYKCHEMGGDQEWKYKGETKSPIYNMAQGMCVGVEKNEINTTIIMKLCSDSTFSKWDFVR